MSVLTSCRQIGSFIAKIFCCVKPMYRNFFSLSELPFSISPDPKYLFMSDRHKEALSHLTYGLGEVGGFALLTGEVGTGKTTVSRCLMEQLPENTQAAFILNPTLSSQELLATICDQLKIRYRKTGASLKLLTDKISEKLLKNHENEINTLLIIDEAQHLQPEVLEQLRLLTNLETNTKKLLQVILIGQPELQQLLQRRDLRQLAQRITARYHLMPLTKQELKQYVEHRLQVADCARSLFDKNALAKIHLYSQGIPRLINLICHSALMLAYNQNDSVVNKKTVIAAAERALGEDINIRQGSNTKQNKSLIAATALSVTAFAVLAGFWWGQTQTLPQTEQIDSAADDSAVTETINKSVAGELADTSDSKASAASDEQELVKTEMTPIEQNTADVSAPDEVSESTFEEEQQLVISANSTKERSQTLREASSVETVSAAQINEKKPTENKTEQYQLSEVDGVSSDLLARFQAAIDETANEISTDSANDLIHNNASRKSTQPDGLENIKPITQMSAQLQNALPNLQFEQHIYASNGQGWVNVNGRDRYEGDYISDKLIVEKILPQQVILSFEGEKFSLPALTNW